MNIAEEPDVEKIMNVICACYVHMGFPANKEMAE